MAFNQCTFIGHAGKDPEVKTLSSGAKVCNFSIAVTEKWKKNGEKVERTEWVNIVVWSEGLIGIVERYVKKGSKLLVQGKMQTRKYEKDGVGRYATEIVLQGFDAKIELLDPKGEGSEDHGSSGYGAASGGGGRTQAYTADLDDEIPF